MKKLTIIIMFIVGITVNAQMETVRTEINDVEVVTNTYSTVTLINVYNSEYSTATTVISSIGDDIFYSSEGDGDVVNVTMNIVNDDSYISVDQKTKIFFLLEGNELVKVKNLHINNQVGIVKVKFYKDRKGEKDIKKLLAYPLKQIIIRNITGIHKYNVSKDESYAFYDILSNTSKHLM